VYPPYLAGTTNYPGNRIFAAPVEHTGVFVGGVELKWVEVLPARMWVQLCTEPV
jgi:hypothetical protein